MFASKCLSHESNESHFRYARQMKFAYIYHCDVNFYVTPNTTCFIKKTLQRYFNIHGIVQKPVVSITQASFTGYCLIVNPKDSAFSQCDQNLIPFG